MKSLILILPFFIIATFSHATLSSVIRHQPQMNQYSTINHFEQQNEMAGRIDQEFENDMSKIKCYRCGRNGHYASQCNRRDVVCYHCGELGHISSDCENQRKVKSVRKVFALNADEIPEPDNLIRDTQGEEH